MRCKPLSTGLNPTAKKPREIAEQTRRSRCLEHQHRCDVAEPMTQHFLERIVQEHDGTSMPTASTVPGTA